MTIAHRYVAFFSLLLISRSSEAIELTLPGEERTGTLTFTQSLLVDYHTDVDDLTGNDSESYGDVTNRTNIILLHGGTSFNLRVDGTGFLGTDEGSPHEGNASLEKISLSSNQRSFEITLGDFYLRIGRGLALDLTRVNELFRDTTLRGGQFRLRWRSISGLVFGGWTNPLNMDFFKEVPVQVPADVIGGARVEVQPSRLLRAGLHYVGGGLQALGTSSRNAVHTLGGTIEFPNVARRLNLYAELDYMSKVQDLEIVQGFGIYTSANGNFGPLAALLEFKFYQHLQFLNDYGSEESTFIYNRPPTLSRTKDEVINNHDVLGPRLRLDLRVGPWDTVLYASYGYFYRSDALPDAGFFASGVTYHDAFGGIQQPVPGGALDLSGGYRIDKRQDDQGESITDYSQAFAEAELSMMVFRKHTMEIEIQYRKIEKSAQRFWDFYLAMGYRPAEYFSVGFSYEHSTEKQDPDPTDEVGVRNHFGGFRATGNFTPSSYARVFAGTTHGGVRCIDGFCREVPPFIGVKLELVVQL